MSVFASFVNGVRGALNLIGNFYPKIQMSGLDARIHASLDAEASYLGPLLADSANANFGRPVLDNRQFLGQSVGT